MEVEKAPVEDLGELTRLMETFNQATERLGQSYRTIGELQKEIAEKDRQLARKTRLETLGRMAAGLAHEIRNPLGGIQLYASMLARSGDADKVRPRPHPGGDGGGTLVEHMLASAASSRSAASALRPLLERRSPGAGPLEEKRVRWIRARRPGRRRDDAAGVPQYRA